MAQLTQNKLLVLGAQVPGYNDFAQSPVHGLVPGPLMHAMALDNLLTYGNQHKRNLSWGMRMSGSLLATTLLLVTAVFLVNWAIKRVMHARIQRIEVDVRQRPMLVRLTLQFTAWAIKLWVISLVAMLLVSMLSHAMPFGLLPVTELVSVAIAAEGLGYAAWLKRQISPDVEDTKILEETHESSSIGSV